MVLQYLISSTCCIPTCVDEIRIALIVPTKNVSGLCDKFAIIVFGKNRCFAQTRRMFSTMLELVSKIVFLRVTTIILVLQYYFKICNRNTSVYNNYLFVLFKICLGTSNVNVILSLLSIKFAQSIGLVLYSLSKKVLYVTNALPWKMLLVILLMISSIDIGIEWNLFFLFISIGLKLILENKTNMVSS